MALPFIESRVNLPRETSSLTGTRITVHGTIQLPGRYGVPLSIYSVDDGPRTIFNETGAVPYANANETFSHVPFFTSPELSYGDHTILITTYNVDTKREFVFDYFTVEGVDDGDGGIGGDDGDRQGEGFTIVDDVDERVKYEGAWVSGSRSWDYAQTDHLSPAGVNGSATFTFSGTSIAAYGRINNENITAVPLAELILDEGTGQQQVSRYSTEGTITWRNHLQLAVWNGLPAGQHTLKVIALGDRNPSWWMDYFVYGTENANQTALRGFISSDPPPTATTFTSSGQIITATVDPPPTDTTGAPGESPTTTGGGRTSKGAIAGGVVGGLLGLGLVAFLIFYFLRRRRKSIQRGQEIRYHQSMTPAGTLVVAQDLASPMSLTPMAHLDPVANDHQGGIAFTAGSERRRTGTARNPSILKGRFSAFPLSPNSAREENRQTIPPTTTYSPPSVPPPPPTAFTPSSLDGLASTVSSPPPLSDSASTPGSSSVGFTRRRERIQETDGGIRLDHWQRYEEEEEDTLPPSYAQYQ
ncbi:hypothetical protein FRC17_002207 [Serendipita sp. 399]|nr:hypothetical protein FRC17_002207 [Serendipita sp. 399]